MKYRYIILVAILLCCQGKVGPDPVDIVEAEFALAQTKVAEEYTIRAWRVTADDFNWKRYSGPFMCGDELANGCFHYPSRTISWNSQVPRVIRYEACHGILYVLGFYDDWRHGC